MASVIIDKLIYILGVNVMQVPINSPFIRAVDLANLLGITRQAIKKQIDRGLWDVVKVGKSVLIRKSSIQGFDLQSDLVKALANPYYPTKLMYARICKVRDEINKAAKELADKDNFYSSEH